jgi:hypothetical protein
VIVLAHGVGTRSDLPLPLDLVLYGAGAAVALSFAALLLLWRTPKLTDPNAGLPLPRAVQAVVDSTGLRMLVRVVALALVVFVVVVALFGPPTAARNLAPWALYVTFWVGLLLASLLLGPVWRVLNPLRLLYAGLARLTGPPPYADRLPALGYWPAAAALAAFVWLELVYPQRAMPATVGIFLVLYSVVQLLAALWFGAGWFARGDGFEVYSSLLGRLSPFGRREDGRLVLHNPLLGPASLPAERGLAAVVVVLVGSTAFDGLSRTPFWQTGIGADNDTASGTLGLAVMIALTAALYLLGTTGTALLEHTRPATQWRRYAHSLIPIAAGYAIAHYFSLLLLDGQFTYILASNPFAQDDVDVFGTYGNQINYTAIGTETIARIQVNAIVLGHVLGVVLAHDQAVQAKTHTSVYSQLPLVLVMIAYTVGGLALLFGGG